MKLPHILSAALLLTLTACTNAEPQQATTPKPQPGQQEPQPNPVVDF